MKKRRKRTSKRSFLPRRGPGTALWRSYSSLAALLEAECVPCPVTGCWLWPYGESRPGGISYGLLNWRGRVVRPHREVMSEILGRKFGPREFVCHRCEVSLCCNPTHLYVGDARTNGMDRAGRFRGAIVGMHDHPRPPKPTPIDEILASTSRISHQRFYQRMEAGWTREEAMFTPKGQVPERVREQRRVDRDARLERLLEEAQAIIIPERGNISELCRIYGVPRGRYAARRRLGYSHEQALTGIGVRKRGRPRLGVVEAV